MSQLTARDLMTPDVVTVPPETPVIAVARLLAERGIPPCRCWTRPGRWSAW